MKNGISLSVEKCLARWKEVVGKFTVRNGDDMELWIDGGGVLLDLKEAHWHERKRKPTRRYSVVL